MKNVQSYRHHAAAPGVLVDFVDYCELDKMLAKTPKEENEKRVKKKKKKLV